ncbi:MAG: hypothetical protein GEU76_02010 [Alphaproteobacteria bacterium]|jgi:hypothetical protein|nr:hypothetical protein [Alphaproteobacteria bacterium]
MAQLVLAVGSSHGPSIQISPDQWPRLGEGDTRDPRFNFQELLKQAKPGLDREIVPEVQRVRHAAAHAALKVLTDIVNEARLDVVVVISNIHRVRPADHHPVFGVFRAESFPVVKRDDQPFDPDARFVSDEKRARERNLADAPGHAALANYLIENLIADDFDVACLDRLHDGAALDDAFTFPYEWLFGGRRIPSVPFLLSRDLPNQATPRRCHAVGIELGRLIRAFPGDARVGLVASGGLSHQVLDEELDRQVVDALAAGTPEALYGLDRARLNRGPGTPEILNWIAVAGAMAPARMTLVDYVPAYRSLAGTGHGLTFGYWR